MLLEGIISKNMIVFVHFIDGTYLLFKCSRLSFACMRTNTLLIAIFANAAKQESLIRSHERTDIGRPDYGPMCLGKGTIRQFICIIALPMAEM